jgi:nicotinamide-nucleotide amidase
VYLPHDEAFGSPHLFLLPGPPRELKPMFFDEVYPRLADLRNEDDRSDGWHNFRIYGVGESSLASLLEPKLAGIEDLELGYCARLGEVDLRLIGSETAIFAASEIVRAEYREDIVAESEAPIEQVVQELLSERGQTVSTAESCTGGNIASTLTNASGSSAVFHRGYVTYANDAKTEILGVPEDLLAEFGAVSEPVVRAMAEGCLRVSGADHAIAVSGIAGPTGGTEEKPVGTVYIGIASRDSDTFAKRYFSPSDRISFKMRVTRLSLDLLRRRLCGFALD